jgi:hypothetical protein
MTAILFVVVLVIVAGLVAAAGDRMGHRAARAKIRIGNLRPRTASTIIAVGTGVIISLLTFGVVFASWADFRDALLHFERIKHELASTQDSLQASKAEASQKEGELKSLNDELKTGRNERIELVKDLDGKRRELDQATLLKARLEREVRTISAEVKKLNNEKAIGEKGIQGLTDLKNQLGQDIEGLESKVASYQKGSVIMPRGAYLAYQIVRPGDAANLAAVLDGALQRVTVNLSKDGLGVAADAADAAQAFVSSYAYADAGENVVVIISAAKNVFEGEGVTLAFEARPLGVLAKSGDVVLSVIVNDREALPSVLGQPAPAIAVPAQFDLDKLEDFSVALQSAFDRAARSAGFLPDLKTGEIASPVLLLGSAGDDLIKRQRPFVIQFVAKRDCTALDGLADAEVYISNPPGTP